MRYQSPGARDVLTNATTDGLVTRMAVWVSARNRATGLPAEVGVWDGDEDLGLTVISGATGATVTRAYYGGGALLKVSDIPRVSDFTVQTVTIDLSQIADAALAITREYDLHLAGVEVHEILLSPATGQPVGADLPVFVGIVDGAPVRTPRVGGEGSAVLKCVSEVMALLTRTNPEKASYEAQKLRDGDEWNLYAGVVETWEIPWGTK
ncbi:hypothetical protein [Mycoplana ramosa]|uniref:Uncharacterized protein n=1 Tax=Mycoplana ramosa TaxID=40837 RepID=A0ABW3Z283_MYCRA